VVVKDLAELVDVPARGAVQGETVQ
jgi:hypothetical protein